MATLNYPLTDFSLKELRILSRLIESEITEDMATIKLIHLHLEDGTDTKRDTLNDASKELPELREMHVRVLTAIDIVKQRETTNAN